MAILPLQGKVVNAAKASRKQVLDNAEAEALFTSSALAPVATSTSTTAVMAAS